MNREIKCTICKKNMGVIRDAKLRSGIKYMCQPCDSRRMEILIEWSKMKKDNKNPLKDLFGGGIFN